MLLQTCVRRASVLAVLLGTMMVSGIAQADNPVNWAFSVETTGGNAFWNSSTAVDTNFPQYDYTYTVTQLDVEVLGFLVFDLSSQVSPGGGTYIGQPPLTIVNQTVSYVDGSSTTSMDLTVGVDASGFGHVSVTNVTLGTFGGAQITKITVGGDVELTGVPEPGCLSMLAIGGATLLGRRSRKRQR